MIWYDEKGQGAWENEEKEIKSRMGESNKRVKWRVVDIW